ncbi:2521_t:CDS:10 [Entrophospora sp. SA101]|nr:2521_t:CDS:10 [Entrophospora sp. SA101]CAJ0918001.1 626_t:CDS:10 [Entrophospora sp. SA101]
MSTITNSTENHDTSPITPGNWTSEDIKMILDPRIYSYFYINKTYPGTEGNSNKCSFISTPQLEDNITIAGQPVVWHCPAGNFCLGPSEIPLPCTAGFFCPENSAQPVYCCKGYYCSKDTKFVTICPEGYQCGFGTVDPIPCGIASRCPPGSIAINKYGSLLFLVATIMIVLLVLYVQEKIESLKTKKYQKLLVDQSLTQKTKLNPLSKTFDIEFKNLGLILSNGVEIIRGITGSLQHGRTCAIMGPSGSGKTTFMALLSGKTKRSNGIIKVNGVIEDLHKHRKLVGFVPQEVREILMHSALMRLPTNMSREAKKKRVIEAIQFLELTNVMNSCIGDEEKRGISGGQRKRVNIGMELVAEPSILFLASLDSVTSFEVCSLLKNVAHQQGLTVAAVIHSPSPQAFNTFDDFVLLCKGGRLIYNGVRENAISYFSSLGYVFPPEMSCKESCHMKIVMEPEIKLSSQYSSCSSATITTTTTTTTPTTPTASTTTITTSTTKNSKLSPIIQFIKDKIIIPVTRLLKDIQLYIEDVIFELIYFIKNMFLNDPVRQTPNSFSVFILLLKRSLLQIYRNKTRFVMDQILNFFAGSFLSASVSNYRYIGAPPQELCVIMPMVLRQYCQSPLDTLQYLSTFMILGLTFCGIYGSSTTFGCEKVVYWREISSGMSAIPYFFAKAVADIPRLIAASLMFSISFIMFYSNETKFSDHYLIILLSYIAAWGSGYFISIIVSKEQIGLVGTAFALAWGLVFGGSNPTLTEVESNSSYASIRWLWEISAQRWAIEAAYLKELSSKAWHEIHDAPLNFTYKFDEYDKCLRNICLIASCWFLLAFLALKLINRDKQK